MNIIDFSSGPLYLAVKQQVIERIVSEYWKPGDILPSEAKLAEQLNVSPGTVRKALNELTQERILLRRQGKGTFVASHTPQRSLFHFFKLTTPDGQRDPSVNKTIENTARKANKEELRLLNLPKNSKIVHIRRLRELGGVTCILEKISLPQRLFPKLAAWPMEEIRNDLYTFYEEEYGITVYQARETLSAVGASGEVAKRLGVAEGSPVLEISRIASGLDGEPIELRKSFCITEHCHYLSELH